MGRPDEYLAWSTYKRLNATVASEFFAADNTGRSIYLDLEDDALLRVVAAADLPSDDPRTAFFDAVAATLSDADSTMFARHAGSIRLWRMKGQQGPLPVLGLLAFLSLVAESMQRDENLSAAAYYSRFAEAVGGGPNDEALLRRIKTGHRLHAQALWEALNAWIKADPRRGIPTAFAFDHRTYIGPALTQALVREGDRDVLKGLFSWARLSPDQEISQDEMVVLLEEWLPDSNATQSLKRLCVLGAYERVAAVALAELRSWDGGGASAAHSGGLRLVGRLRKRPKARLELGVLVRLPSGSATFDAMGARETFDLEDERTGSTIGRPAGVAKALNAPAAVISDGARVSRPPKSLVVLRADGDHAHYVEVDRADLGLAHIVLARTEVADGVGTALDQIARPGWKRLNTVAGLPAGWCAFTGVEVVAIGAYKDVREALIPHGWTQLALHGGFRLPGRQRWLASAPPELGVNSLKDDQVEVTASLALGTTVMDSDEVDDTDDYAVPRAVVERMPASDGDTIDLDARFHEAGTLYFAASPINADETLAQARCELVTADPRSIDHEVAHRPSINATWPVSATRGSGGLRGALIPPESDRGEPETDLGGQALTPAATSASGTETTSDDIDDDLSVVEAPLHVPECFITGRHVYRVPTGRRRPEPVELCEHCGRESIASQRRGVLPARPRKATILPRRVGVRDPEENVLLALSATGHGSRGALDRIIDQVDDQPWAVSERARTLSSLGHVDLAFDENGRIREWGIAPPALGLTADDDLVLCGWRSPQLVRDLERLAADLGLEVVREGNAEAPDRIALVGPDLRTAMQLLDGEQLAGASLAVSERPGKHLARLLPDAATLVSTLPPRRGTIELERLDPATRQWTRCDHPTRPGAYRTRQFPRRTYYYDGVNLRACDVYLARWLAGTHQHRQLHYDPDAAALAVNFGSRLPGLWERAAVLESGRPYEHTSTHLIYIGVGNDVGTHIAQSLDVPMEPITVA